MADPISVIGLATGIIGLVPICADGFTFIEGICKAQDGLGNQVIRIRGQKAILRGWGKTWDIPLEENQPSHGKKLQKWIEEYPEGGSDVQETLYAISDIFADTNNLEKKYGVAITQEDADLRKLNIEELLGGRIHRKIGEQDVRVIRNHMNIVMRCHFKLRGEKKFAELVKRLKEFVENLLKMCSEVQAQRIEKAILKQLSNSDNPDDLKSISRVYEQEVEDRKRVGQRYQGYELIKEVFDFKARVQHLARRRAEETAKRRVSRRSNAFLLSTRFLDTTEFRYESPTWDPQESTVTLATVDKLDALRYLEWKSYADNSDYESHILELADFLGVPNRPAAFQVLPCLGIFRDEAYSRFGFAFELPSYIGNLKPKKSFGREGALRSRMPVTLLDLIQQQTIVDGRPSILPLGDRFHIARKLAQTLYVMHAIGWVHKNIRSSSVIFVLAESTSGGIPSRSGAKDLANPYLGGFGFSRPEVASPDEDDNQLATVAPKEITLDCYHHPRKRWQPSIRYKQAFDLYSYVQHLLINLVMFTHQRHLEITNTIALNSEEVPSRHLLTGISFISLGTVLLEIGLWQSLESFEPLANLVDDFEFTRCLIKITKRELPGQMGNIYAEAVEECLVSRSKDTDPYTLDRLCWKVCAALDQCVA